MIFQTLHSNIFRVTTGTGNDEHLCGNRHPAVWIHPGKADQLHISSCVNNEGYPGYTIDPIAMFQKSFFNFSILKEFFRKS